MDAIANDESASDHHVAHVGGGGGEDQRLDGMIGRGSRQAHAIEPYGDQVGERAGLDPARLRPPPAPPPAPRMLPRPPGGRARSSPAAEWIPRVPPSSRSSSSTARAS